MPAKMSLDTQVSLNLCSYGQTGSYTIYTAILQAIITSIYIYIAAIIILMHVLLKASVLAV